MKRHITFARLLRGVVAGACLMLPMAASVMASSHREAPLITKDPLADNTDVYAFRSPNDPNTITIIANYIPMQLPHGGPNYYFFGENVRYEIHIDNKLSTTGDDIIYRFTFNTVNQDPSTFFKVRLGLENLKNTYTLERSTNGGASFSTIVSNGVVPAYRAGERTIQSAVGLNAPSYSALMSQAIMTASTGERVFAGPVDDPFFVDLGAIFDLGDAPRTAGINNGPVRDGLACKNVHTIAIQIPISTLQKDNLPVAQAANILDSDFIIGVWASASRQQIRTLTGNGTETYSGNWVQVSRLGMPLTNEVIIPIGQKDEYNRRTPYNQGMIFSEYFYNPELALYMDPAFFASAVPAFAPLRIQKNSLGSFGFGNTQDGLFPLKGSAALQGTALGDPAYEDLLLPGPGKPRSVDLWPIFHTGVPNLRPYQLATGKPIDNPLAAGKPFINNFLPNGGDMLRLNMAVPVTARNSPQFSSLGLIQAAVLGLTAAPYNTNMNLEFIPNMDGFPNGRRLEDDVTRIELQAVAGVVLAAIGLPYDDYQTGSASYPLSQDLLDVLGYTTGVEMNDTTFMAAFPYEQAPWSGKSRCSGEAITYIQPAILAPSNTQPVCMSGTYTINSGMATNGTNFQSFTAASQALTFNGICGPVTFNVAANSGPYNDKLMLGEITGSSSVNTITINGAGNVLNFCSNDKSAPSVILLDGTDNVIISNVTINVTCAYGWAIHLMGDVENITIQNSTINLPLNYSRYIGNMQGIISSNSFTNPAVAGGMINGLTITGNTINNGYHAIRLNGSSTSLGMGVSITGNTLNNPSQYGMHLSYLMGPVVSANAITMRTGFIRSNGISIFRLQGGLTLTRNLINNAGQNGIYLNGVNTSSTTRGTVANNMIGGFQNPLEAHALIFNFASYLDIYYNSTNVNTAAFGTGVWVSGASSNNLNMMNNSFAYTGGGTGYAMKAWTPESFLTLDFNNYYATGSKFVFFGQAERANLADLQNAPGNAMMTSHDMNSMAVNPMYVSATDLHLQGTSMLRNMATPVSVTVDYDNQGRDSTPDIGADEVAGAPRLAAASPESDLNVMVYPNPFDTQSTFSYKVEQTGRVTIRVYDLTGRLIGTPVDEVKEPGQYEQVWQPQRLAAGVYVAKVLDSNGEIIHSVKLIKID